MGIYKRTYLDAPTNYSQVWYRANREKVIERNRQRKLAYRKYYMDNKNKPCTDCGGTFNPYVWSMTIETHQPNYSMLVNHRVFHP